MSEKWVPTPLEISQAQVAVLADTLPLQCDAVFIHGSPIRDDQLDRQILKKVMDNYMQGRFSRIILNGLTEEACREKNLAYAGCGPWIKTLGFVDNPGMDIVLLEPSAHTGAESRNLLKMAKEKGWQKIAISSHPHHQLRCFLQIIALMEEVGWTPDVYNIPGPAIDWNRQLKKPVMAGTGFSEDVNGTLSDHIAAEYERIVAYAQQPEVVDGKPKFTRHATIPEMMEYLAKRN
jgi:hypothetical protein